MLSTNSILQQGRYRIIGQFGTAGGCVLYDAYDNLLGNKVVLHETVLTFSKVITASERDAHAAAFTERIKNLKDIRHDGFVRVRDGFSEVDRHYLVSEPVEGKLSPEEFVTRPRETIDRLLTAVEFINELEKRSVALEITPGHIRRTADGNNRLLFFGIGLSDVNDRSQLPYKALESLWDGLDLASQKAISNDYDEPALETLESDPDSRTGIYAVGATVYQILTGKSPADALERSIELLDGKDDPLVTPTDANSGIAVELSNFLLKAMELRRENRFQNVAEARTALPVAANTKPQKTFTTIAADDFDEFDLLEIIDDSPAKPAPVASAPRVISHANKISAHNFSSTAVLEEPAAPSMLTKVENTAIRDAQAAVISSQSVSFTTEKAESPIVQTTRPIEEDTFTFDIEQPARNNMARIVSMAVGAAVLIGVGIWGFMAFSSSGQSVSGTKYDSGAAVMKDEQAAPALSQLPPPSLETPATTIDAPATTEVTATNAVESEQQPLATSVDKTPAQATATAKRPAIAEVKPTKPEQPTTLQKAAPKTKKSVTVDDLIN